MTAPRRLSARLDVKNDFVIKGIHLEGLRKIEIQMNSQKNTILKASMKLYLWMQSHHIMIEIA